MKCDGMEVEVYRYEGTRNEKTGVGELSKLYWKGEEGIRGRRECAVEGEDDERSLGAF